MCTAESGPSSEYIGPMMPTIHATPCVGHAYALVNSANTACADWRGDSVQSGIRIAKKPNTCMIRMTPSMSGSFFAKNVLNRIATLATAMIIRVPCHACGTYEALFSMIMPWTWRATR